MGSKNGGYVRRGCTITGWFVSCPAVWSVLESFHGLPLGTFPQFLRLNADGFLLFIVLGGWGKCRNSLIYSSLALVAGDQTWQLVEMVFGYLPSVISRLTATSLRGSNVAMINNFKTT